MIPPDGQERQISAGEIRHIILTPREGAKVKITIITSEGSQSITFNSVKGVVRYLSQKLGIGEDALTHTEK